MGHDSLTHGTWLIYAWNSTHSEDCVQTVDKSIFIKQARGTLDLPQTSRANPVECYSTHQEMHETRLIQRTVCRQQPRHDSCIRDMTHSHVTWLIHTLDMTHPHIIHDSLRGLGLCASSSRNTTHSHVGHDSLACGTWFIRMWDMTHSHVGHDSPRWLRAGSNTTLGPSPAQTHCNKLQHTLHHTNTHFNTGSCRNIRSQSRADGRYLCAAKPRSNPPSRSRHAASCGQGTFSESQYFCCV